MTDGVNSGDEASDRKKGLFARFKKGQPGKGQSEQPAPVEKEVVSAAVVTTDVATEVTEKASETGGDDGGSNVAGVFDAEKAVSAELGFSEEQSLSIKMASDPVKVVSVDTASNIEEGCSAGKLAGSEKDPAVDAGDESRFAKLRRVFSRQSSQKGSSDSDGAASLQSQEVSSETPRATSQELKKTHVKVGSYAEVAIDTDLVTDIVETKSVDALSINKNAGSEITLDLEPDNPDITTPASGTSAESAGEGFRSEQQSVAEVPVIPLAEVQVDLSASIEEEGESTTTSASYDALPKTATPEAPTQPMQEVSVPETSIREVSIPEISMPRDKPGKQERFLRIKQALARTRKGLGRVFLGRKQIDEELLEDLETHLLTADLGFDVTSELIEALADSVKRKELNDVEALQSALRKLLVDILKPCEVPLDTQAGSPFVLLTVGVNGVGKTTTIGKLAKQYLNENKSVVLAAGDTFRAAAVEQLQVWGERNQVHVVAQHTGADSASVIFDAVESAKAKGADILIADTAGRLHTKSNLMDELKKIKRVVGKLDAAAPHEVLLVVDAGTGQNAVTQLKQFHEAVGVTGIVLTKLDGTAKGGVIFALCRRFGIPIRFIGVGEGVDDLQPFKAEDFVDALLSQESQLGAAAEMPSG